MLFEWISNTVSLFSSSRFTTNCRKRNFKLFYQHFFFRPGLTLIASDWPYVLTWTRSPGITLMRPPNLFWILSDLGTRRWWPAASSSLRTGWSFIFSHSRTKSCLRVESNIKEAKKCIRLLKNCFYNFLNESWVTNNVNRFLRMLWKLKAFTFFYEKKSPKQ